MKIPPRILNLETKRKWWVRFTPGEITPAPTEKEARWSPERLSNPQSRYGCFENKKSPWNRNTVPLPSIQQTSHYTDWAIPANETIHSLQYPSLLALYNHLTIHQHFICNDAVKQRNKTLTHNPSRMLLQMTTFRAIFQPKAKKTVKFLII
jgi:hypothetical protein